MLIRDAAYAGIPKERRSQLHERFANWAARTNAGRAGELDEIIGYHLEQAFQYCKDIGAPDPVLAVRAAAALGAAGSRALERSDMPAALSLLARSLALSRDDEPPPAVVHLRQSLLVEA